MDGYHSNVPKTHTITDADRYGQSIRNAAVHITGGTFSSDPTVYVAGGYTVTKTNGKYVVS